MFSLFLHFAVVLSLEVVGVHVYEYISTLESSKRVESPRVNHHLLQRSQNNTQPIEKASMYIMEGPMPPQKHRQALRPQALRQHDFYLLTQP